MGILGQEILSEDGVENSTQISYYQKIKIIDFITKTEAELGVEESLINFEGLSPQMLEALGEDGIKTLDEFATCADWELAGGWTTVDGERVKDDGILEKFDVSLEEAQDLVMTARVMLGWVNPDDLTPSTEEIEE